MYRQPVAPKDPADARSWLSRTFPYRDDFSAGMLSELGRCEQMAVHPPDRSFLGTAFEYAIGLDLSETVPYPDLFDSLDDHTRWLHLQLAGYQVSASDEDGQYSRWRNTGTARPSRLFTVAASLAHLRPIVWAVGVADPATRRTGLASLLRHRPAIRRWQRETWHARPAFGKLWESYTRGFRGLIRSYGPLTPAPTLVDGRRTADAIAGTTLIEVKTGRLDQPAYMHDLIDQLLTYGLLAPLDGYTVERVAVYAARYQRLLLYPRQELLDLLAGHPVNAARAARHLAEVIRAADPKR